MTTEDKPNYVTEGIAIAGFTLFSYIIAFQYESGFCSYWQIPKYFIDISLTTAVAAGLGLLSFLLGIFLIVNLPISLLDNKISKEDSLQRRVIIFHLGVLFFLIALIKGYGVSAVTIFFTVFILIIDSILFFIPWYLDKRKNPEKTDIFKRITRYNESSINSNDGYHWVYILFGSKLYWILLFIIPVVSLIASAAGSASAKQQQDYLVVESDGLILVKRYGETYILRTIDLTNNKVSGQILIWRSEDIANHKFSPKFLNNIEIANS